MKNDELGRRIRAALAYAYRDGSYAAKAAPMLDKLGHGSSEATINRMRSGAWFAGKPPAVIRDVLLGFAELCDVPSWFMLSGFNGQSDGAQDVPPDIAELRASVDEMRLKMGLVPIYGAKPPQSAT